MVDADKYNFKCEHYEERSEIMKEFIITYYDKRNGPAELSVFDQTANKVFLKRGVYDQDGPVRLEDMFIGGTVTICARKFKVVAYADSCTRCVFEQRANVVHSVVPSDMFPDLGSILCAAWDNGFAIRRIKTMPQFGALMEFVGEDAVQRWLGVLQETLGDRADKVSAEPASSSTERQFELKDTTATYDNCSLCIVRPHALREGQAGIIVSALLDSGLQLTAMQTFSLLKSQSEMFYEVYKTVIPSAQYSAMIKELSSGLCLAIEVCAEADAVKRLRELCGPFDVEIAKHLRPNTLRAQLGRDNVHNSVHCTDLPEDGGLESQYFFSILHQAGVC